MKEKRNDLIYLTKKEAEVVFNALNRYLLNPMDSIPDYSEAFQLRKDLKATYNFKITIS